MPHKDRLKHNASGSRYYWANREQVTKRAKFKRLLNIYGLTEEAFNNMVIGQSGLCAICQKTMKPGLGTNVDHCHRTGKVRALLCTSCNAGIGYLKDDPAIVAAALAYLEAHNAK